MAQQKLRKQDIVGLGYLKRLFPLLEKLHDVGCARDKAGNRDLHFDQYCKLVLLYIWNPVIGSIGGLQQAVGLDSVAKAVGVKRFSAGSFSESPRVFDPELLKPIIAEFAGELTGQVDPRLKDLDHVLTLVDGTVLRGLVALAKAACLGTAVVKGEPHPARYNTLRDGKAVYGWRLHTQFDLKTFCPHRIYRTGARNAGDARESNVLTSTSSVESRRTLESGRCYVGDGGYNDRSLFDDIHNAQSSYVIRVAENSVFEAVEEKPVTPAAADAGVVHDIRVSDCMRRVELKVSPHIRRKRSGTKETDRLILYTNLLELPAELIALIYSFRYTVELFFRVFKQLLGARHLLSQKNQGLDIQIYCTVLACILIQLISGKKPSIAMRRMISWYLLGVATEAEVMTFLNKPDNKGVKLRAKEELWKKLGF